MAQKKQFDYFASKDGEEVAQKMKAVMEPTLLTAFAIATTDVMLYSQPKGYLKTLGRYAFVGLPLVGVSTVFVMTSNLVGSIRKKNDLTNWFIGGAAAGSIFGIWSRRPVMGFNMGLFLGILAVIRKDVAQRGWRLTPSDDSPIANGGVWSVNTDWSITAERPRNWTTGKQ